MYIATYLPVIVGAVMVGGLEWTHPHRQQWRAEKQEWLQDAIFMALTQGAFPKLVAVLFSLSQAFHARDFIVPGWWPTYWPVPLQVLVMMVAADGMRYWLHRGAHEWEPL